MNTTTLRITENGLSTADGKGILPGSHLVVKSDYIPPSWTGLYEDAATVGERQLVVATPNDRDNELEELRAANESIGQERARLLQDNERLTGEIETAKQSHDLFARDNERLTAEVAGFADLTTERDLLVEENAKLNTAAERTKDYDDVVKARDEYKSQAEKLQKQVEEATKKGHK